MAKYFIMLEGERQGPFSLEQLPSVGITPDTYVWTKGMDDWEKAGKVADICRLFRNRIFDLNHPSLKEDAPEQRNDIEAAEDESSVPIRFSRWINPEDMPAPGEIENVNTSHQPQSLSWIAIMVTLLCSPLGFVAIYYAWRSRYLWMKASGYDANPDKTLDSDRREERDHLRSEAHDCSRKAKMWIGISFFLGIIFYAFLLHNS